MMKEFPGETATTVHNANGFERLHLRDWGLIFAALVMTNAILGTYLMYLILCFLNCKIRDGTLITLPSRSVANIKQ
jgi:hypothetical protein